MSGRLLISAHKPNTVDASSSPHYPHQLLRFPVTHQRPGVLPISRLYQSGVPSLSNQPSSHARQSTKNLSFYIYKCMYNLGLGDNYMFDWIKFVKGILDKCGYTYVLETQTFITDIKQVIKVRLQDHFNYFGYLQFIIRQNV